MTVFLALQEAFKAVPDPQDTVKFCQRISQMLKDAPANYSGLRKEYEVREFMLQFFKIQFKLYILIRVLIFIKIIFFLIYTSYISIIKQSRRTPKTE